MLWFILLGVLAAFGALCGVWVLFGWLLPGSGEGITVLSYRPGARLDGALTRYGWLRELGLLRGPILIVGDLPDEARNGIARRHRGVEFCSPEALCARLEQERT